MSDTATIAYGLYLLVYDVVGTALIVWALYIVIRCCKGGR
jgi:hypothetical protein